MLAESLSPRLKNFFSERFNLSLQLDPKGGITGTLYPFGNLDVFTAKISGLYSKINSNTALSFICEFANSNLTAKTFICFSGEIIKYEKKYECLILRWVMEQDTAGLEWVDRDIEILLSSKTQDWKGEILKVKEHIDKYSLSIIQ
jgi:hypothetical protein